MFLFGRSEREGWFFTPTFFAYQRVNDRVYVYITRTITGFYILQLYERSTRGLCTLDAHSDDIETLFSIGEKWLTNYSDYAIENISKDRFYIGTPHWKERCWIAKGEEYGS